MQIKATKLLERFKVYCRRKNLREERYVNRACSVLRSSIKKVETESLLRKLARGKKKMGVVTQSRDRVFVSFLKENAHQYSMVENDLPTYGELVLTNRWKGGRSQADTKRVVYRSGSDYKRIKIQLTRDKLVLIEKQMNQGKWLIFNLLLNGLRTTDLMNLTLSDIDMHKGQVLRAGKKPIAILPELERCVSRVGWRVVKKTIPINTTRPATHAIALANKALGVKSMNTGLSKWRQAIIKFYLIENGKVPAEHIRQNYTPKDILSGLG